MEVERGTSGSPPLLRNTSCHGPCQFSSIQSLSALSVYIGCLQLLSQCGTGTRQWGIYFVWSNPSPMLPRPLFLFNKDETVERGSGKFTLYHERILGKHQHNSFVDALQMFQMSVRGCFEWLKWSFGLFPCSVNQMFWYNSKLEHSFVPFISWNKSIVLFENKSSLISPNQTVK